MVTKAFVLVLGAFAAMHADPALAESLVMNPATMGPTAVETVAGGMAIQEMSQAGVSIPVLSFILQDGEMALGATYSFIAENYLTVLPSAFVLSKVVPVPLGGSKAEKNLVLPEVPAVQLRNLPISSISP